MNINDNFGLGLAMLLLAGVINASFPVPMKYARAWKWENTWLVFAALALLILPWTLAAAFIPRLGELYAGVPVSALAPGFIFGFLWGLAQVTFGIAFGLVGMAMAFAIVVGMCGVLGSFVPLVVLHPADLFGPKGISLMISAAVLVWGLVLYAKAARRREKETNPGFGSQGQADFRKGLAVCIFTGAFGGMINFGFAFSGQLSERAMAMGASKLTATLPVWAIVVTGGFLPNLAYTVYKLIRNRTAGDFGRSTGREGLIAFLMALLWLGGTYGYGLGASVMGTYGTSIGYAVYVTALILWSTAMGIMTGEWKGVQKATYRKMMAGAWIILASVLILSVPGLL